MACSGAHCTNHDTGTASCVGHRPACATNRPFTPSTGFGTQGGDIIASDVDALRTKLREELALYNTNFTARSLANISLLQAITWSIGTDADNEHPEDLRQMSIDLLNLGSPQREAGTELGGAPFFLGSPFPSIEDTDWGTGIADLYETIRTDCICNSNCDCNAICACHNDCGCNYSDETIKTDIVYL